jgi:hypothetical protein
MRKILAAEDEPLLRPTLEIKAFSGVRTEEIVRLWWVMVAEPEGCLKVPDAVGKICARRVPLLPNLQARLAAYAAAAPPRCTSPRRTGWRSKGSCSQQGNRPR